MGEPQSRPKIYKATSAWDDPRICIRAALVLDPSQSVAKAIGWPSRPISVEIGQRPVHQQAESITRNFMLGNDSPHQSWKEDYTRRHRCHFHARHFFNWPVEVGQFSADDEAEERVSSGASCCSLAW
jgi:hypothetical protein